MNSLDIRLFRKALCCRLRQCPARGGKSICKQSLCLLFFSRVFPAILSERLSLRSPTTATTAHLLAMSTATDLQALDTALKTFIEASQPETSAAAYAALQLHSSTPLHETHAIFISAQWDSTNFSPLLSWKIEDVDVMELSKLGTLLDLLMGKKQTLLVDGIEVPLSSTWSQEGLGRFHGLGGDGFRTMVVFLGQGSGTATARFVPSSLEKGTKEQVGERAWEARTDENWLRSYRERLALPAAEREVARKASSCGACRRDRELIKGCCAGVYGAQVELELELTSARSGGEPKVRLVGMCGGLGADVAWIPQLDLGECSCTSTLEIGTSGSVLNVAKRGDEPERKGTGTRCRSEQGLRQPSEPSG